MILDNLQRKQVVSTLLSLNIVHYVWIIPACDPDDSTLYEVLLPHGLTDKSNFIGHIFLLDNIRERINTGYHASFLNTVEEHHNLFKIDDYWLPDEIVIFDEKAMVEILQNNGVNEMPLSYYGNLIEFFCLQLSKS